ncbi:hypothetical protein D915_006483 [Fasciola hepatica]|uniref:Uncharacterized protein n=1 Tax=Fasciola hepatica TaxID=6192 RepID=A0A4E0R4M0_FASHE|nr:hypothetical protein D915_006483 [Fasciola hepatica]
MRKRFSSNSTFRGSIANAENQQQQMVITYTAALATKTPLTRLNGAVAAAPIRSPPTRIVNFELWNNTCGPRPHGRSCLSLLGACETRRFDGPAGSQAGCAQVGHTHCAMRILHP